MVCKAADFKLDVYLGGPFGGMKKFAVLPYVTEPIHN